MKSILNSKDIKTTDEPNIQNTIIIVHDTVLKIQACEANMMEGQTFYNYDERVNFKCDMVNTK